MKLIDVDLIKNHRNEKIFHKFALLILMMTFHIQKLNYYFRN